MPHAYSFFLFSAFLFFTVSWHHQITLKKSFYLGVITALITLVNPANVVIILFFILYGISSPQNFQQKILRILDAHRHIIFMGVIAFFVWIPQLMYWKYITDQWFYNPYSEEGFFFNNPQIINGLFSFRKGWFLYTPLMLLSVGSILLHLKYLKEFFLPLLIFLLVNIYVILSWWCWWYGDSFGQRAFIESYALLSIPLALAVKKIFDLKIIPKITGIAFITLLLFHNLFQTGQYYHGAIHKNSMTMEAYLHSFGRLKPRASFLNLIKEPDYEKAKKGLEENP